jgi:hypothetical protein
MMHHVVLKTVTNYGGDICLFATTYILYCKKYPSVGYIISTSLVTSIESCLRSCRNVIIEKFNS